MSASLPPKLRRAIRVRASERCERCGVSGVRLSVNHIRPVTFGGGDDPENLELVCAPCHKQRHREAAEAEGRPVQGRVARLVPAKQPQQQVRLDAEDKEAVRWLARQWRCSEAAAIRRAIAEAARRERRQP